MKQDIRQTCKTKHTRSQIAGRWLLFWTLFIAIVVEARHAKGFIHIQLEEERT